MLMPKLKDNPPHLFATWLNYRQQVHNEKNNDVVVHINKNVGRDYKSNQISRWKHGDVSIPDNVHKVINLDYPKMLEWLLNQDDILINGCFVDHAKLATKLHVYVPEK